MSILEHPEANKLMPLVRSLMLAEPKDFRLRIQRPQ
jgi:hypothetical protein